MESPFPSASDRKHAELKRRASFGRHLYNRTSQRRNCRFFYLPAWHTPPHMLRLWKYLNIDHNLGTVPFPFIPAFPTLANKCDQAGFAHINKDHVGLIWPRTADISVLGLWTIASKAKRIEAVFTSKTGARFIHPAW